MNEDDYTTVTIRLPRAMRADLDRYMADHRYVTVSECVREIVRQELGEKIL